MKKTMRYKPASIFIPLIMLFAFLISCNTEPEYWKVKSTQQVISEFVASNEEYSEFNALLESTNISSLLAVRGPFTLFLPPNSAMQEYYQQKGIGSFLDLSADQQTELVMNHVISAQIETGDIGLGAIREVNGIGDYLVSEFEGADIIINKNSKIIKRDIRAANGVVHVVEKVLDPVKMNVYEVVKNNPSYSIFAKGLELTNIKDTLQIIDFPFGKKMARTRFTLFAVADSTFQRFGINSVDDLIHKYTSAPESITYMNNGFYRYIEYHCLAETYYLSNLELGEKLYPILSYDNNIVIRVDDDYKINPDDNGKYTGFVIGQSNNPAKNGTVHTINGLMPVIQPKPTRITWETTDHFDVKQLDAYGKTYDRFFDGQNTFANIKWEADYLLYYYKDHDAPTQINWDCLSTSGWWWVEVTTPKIMKGKYEITSYQWGGTNYAVYVDGVNTALIKSGDQTPGAIWAIVDWKKTEKHKIKIVTQSPGLLFWDYIVFTPTN